MHKKTYPSEKASRKLNPPLEYMIIHIVLMRPGIYLREVRRDLREETGTEVCLSAICRFLHRNGFTRQRLRIAASQRDGLLRAQFVSDVSLYKPEMLIFLDETGSDRRDCIRKYGYSLRGKPLVTHRLLVRGQRISAIAFMSYNGILDCKTVNHSVNGDNFYYFVQSTLLPHLMPFDGNNPHSVVILDNCSIHHVEGITEMIEEVGALVHFLPPYSPDYNPIEEAFSKVKSTLKELDVEANAGVDPETLVLAAFSSIEPKDCQQWINHAGIYL